MDDALVVNLMLLSYLLVGCTKGNIMIQLEKCIFLTHIVQYSLTWSISDQPIADEGSTAGKFSMIGLRF